jgi:hypothetical protein
LPTSKRENLSLKGGDLVMEKKWEMVYSEDVPKNEAIRRNPYKVLKFCNKIRESSIKQHTQFLV